MHSDITKGITSVNHSFSFSKTIPYFGSFIIFLGIIKLLIFFSFFRISIVSFLDFSEIITLFLDSLLMLIFCSLFLFLQVFFVIKKDIWIKFYSKRTSIITSIFFLIVLTTVTLILFLSRNNIKAISFIPIIFYIAGAQVFFVYLTYSPEINKINNLIIRDVAHFIILSISLILFTVGLAVGDVVDVKYKNKFYGTIIYVDNNRAIVSDSSTYFIGKTNNYVFIYDEIKRTTDIIPMSEIKKITIKRNHTSTFFFR